MHTRISEIMTRDPVVVAPDDHLQYVAQQMRDWNVGALPVCEAGRLQGMITDRDIVVRATAEGRAPTDCRVREAMTLQMHWCYEDQTVDEVLREMGNEQVRRIPVVNRGKELVGMLSLGDLATRTDAGVQGAVEDISEPGQTGSASADEVRLRRPPSDQADGRF